jgi:hypothetical protein
MRVTRGDWVEERPDAASCRACADDRTISVVIPVLNEAKTIEHLVRLVRLDPRVLEVVVSVAFQAQSPAVKSAARYVINGPLTGVFEVLDRRRLAYRASKAERVRHVLDAVVSPMLAEKVG